MKIAEQILEAYAKADPWKLDHDDAMRCFEMEEIIAVGNMTYKLVSYIVATWQDHVVAGSVPYQDEDDRQISQFYQSWVTVSERNLSEIEKLTRNGFEVKGSEEFATHLAEARSIIESRALEAEMRSIEEILPLANGNPRPDRYGT